MTNSVYTEIENVFTPENYKEILDYARDSEDYTITGYDPMGFWDNRAKRIEPEEFRDSLSSEFYKAVSFPEGITELNGVVMVKYLDEFSLSPEGNDAIYPHFIKNPPMFWDMLVLISLNDDYEGGEIEFPNDGIKFKQKPNTAIVFRGDTVYKVNKVISGKRYMMTIFGK